MVRENKHYRRLWIALAVSELGDQIGWVALIWIALKLTGSPAAVGLVSLSFWLPKIFTFPLVGVLGDRYSRPRLMVMGNVLLMVLFLAISITIKFVNSHCFWVVDILLAWASMFVPFTLNGRAQLIAELVPKERLPQANFFIEIEWQVTYLVGPAIGGLLTATIGSFPVLLLDVCSFLLSALILMTLPSLSENKSKAGTLRKNFVEGLHFLWSKPALISIAIMTFLFNLFYGVYSVALPLIANNQLGGAKMYGTLWTAFAAGSLIGGVIFSKRSWKLPLALSMSMVITLWGVVTIVIGYSSSIALVLVLMLINGLIFTPYSPLYSTIIQKVVPHSIQSRVSGAMSPITSLGTPVGSWVSGITITSLGIGHALVISGIFTIIVGITAAVWRPLRKLDRTLANKDGESIGYGM